MKFLFAFSSLFISLSCVAQISIDSLSAYIGKTIKECIKLRGTFITIGEKPVTYLNSGADYPNTKLTISSFQKDFINFPFTPFDYHKGINVSVTGEKNIYKEKIKIIVNNPELFELKFSSNRIFDIK